MPDFTLDHVVIGVRDLDGATRDYATLLGRGPSWHGSHPKYGTRNTLFRIDNTYVELLSLGKSKSGRWAGELSKFLDIRSVGESAQRLTSSSADLHFAQHSPELVSEWSDRISSHLTNRGVKPEAGFNGYR